jgi:two-component system sensor histidine kinase EvgS
VDDDATIRWLSQRQIEKLGHRVEIAENGQAALQKLLENAYDIVLTDCHMPVMDGVALTQAVRSMPDPALRNLPIIGLTADVTEHQLRVGRDDRSGDQAPAGRPAEAASGTPSEV